MKLNSIAFLIACSTILSGSVFAEDVSSGGTIKFLGTITESACSIGGGTDDQVIAMGDASVTAIENSTSPKTQFNIKLTGCNNAVKKSLSVSFNNANAVNGLLPLVGESDFDSEPVAGAAIQIEDGSTNSALAINSSSSWINFSSGANTLNFKAYLKATGVAGTIKTGKFSATTTFAVTYK